MTLEEIAEAKKICDAATAGHEHQHSLYIHCGSCFMFGIPVPKEHHDNTKCGNCGSTNTWAYWPSCCLDEFRTALPKALAALAEAQKNFLLSLDRINNMLSYNEKIGEENSRLKAALEFYADEKNNEKSERNGFSRAPEVWLDRGARARAALASRGDE